MKILSGILKAIKPLVPDSMVNRGVREYFNRHYSSFGTMTALTIDTEKRKATMELELKGETQPLTVVIEEYEVSTDEEKTFVEIKRLTTSREWINFLGTELLRGKKFLVPELAKSLL